MNPRAFFPSNIGYRPTGVNGVAQVSTFIVGKSTTGTYEGIGLGGGGRPDPLEVMQINLVEPIGDGTFTSRGSITFNVYDLFAAKSSNSNVPLNLNLTLKEVAVCDNGTNKRMIILGSQTYSA